MSLADFDAKPPFLTRMRRWMHWALAGPQIHRQQKSRLRVLLAMGLFTGLFTIIGGKMVLLAVKPASGDRNNAARQEAMTASRPDITDRNGLAIGLDVKTPALYAEPKRIIDAEEATELILSVLPDLDPKELNDRLTSGKGFVWLKREITPEQQQAIHKLGIPGIGFMRENKRIYPNGPTVSHAIGFVNIDNQGSAGLEKWVDGKGFSETHLAGQGQSSVRGPVVSSIDLRVQHVMRDELMKAQEKFRAKAAAGVLSDVNTGEVISMVSIPDYDPNTPGDAINNKDKLNRLTTGVYEMGSVMKAVTVAMALDSGKVSLNSSFDARFALQYGRHTIKDFHAQRRIMSVPEIFIHSSNIGTARMALGQGVEAHKAFLRKMGLLDRLVTELPESRMPLYPKRWVEINTVTAAFGHGIAVAPLQVMMAESALLNGGLLIPPTFIKRTREEAQMVAKRVIKKETSDQMRYLMRLNAEHPSGSGKKANVDGYYVGGKTGTSEKVIGGRYSKNKLLTSFVSVFPADKPRYAMLVMLDEPQATKETFGYATAGYNAAPTTAKIIQRVGPILGLEPRFDIPPAIQSIPVNFRGAAR